MLPLLQLNRDDVILSHNQILSEQIINCLLGHQILEMLLPLALEENCDHLNEHRQGFGLQCGALQPTLIHLSEECCQESKAISLNKVSDELLRTIRRSCRRGCSCLLTLARGLCRGWLRLSNVICAQDEAMEQHDIMECSRWHLLRLRLLRIPGEELVPSLLLTSCILRNRLYPLVECSLKLPVDWKFLQKGNNLALNFFSILHLDKQAE